MPDDIKTPLSGRERTDESLRSERQRADAGQDESGAAREKDADRVILQARRQADDVLDLARDKADQQLEDAGLPSEAVAAIANVSKGRAFEDELLRMERARADESLRQERRQRARMLSALRVDREKTNLDLLTERARSDEALSHRDDFLGIVSHDLRNLLHGIVMSAELLGQEGAGGGARSDVREGTDRIQRYAGRMERLIGDLVDVVSLDAGKLAITAAREDCAAAIDEAVDTFRAAASEGRITLEAKIGERPLPADFDRNRMLQVLANLVANAIKFTPPGGRITVGVERHDGEASFSVCDTGSGIPAEMLERVFERFWQVGKGDRRGLGLGLYISRSIVEAHGGRIWAESREGAGSRFRFTIPIEATAPS
ncbi:MAG: HAMP domain-containing sensor histidine kinase [Acidobacteriota bacterium]